MYGWKCICMWTPRQTNVVIAIVLNWMSVLEVWDERTFAPICPHFSDSVFSRRFGREDPLAPHSNCYGHCIFEKQFPHLRDRMGSPLDTADAKYRTAVCFLCTVRPAVPTLMLLSVLLHQHTWVGGDSLEGFGGKEFSAWLVFGSEQV